MNRLWSRVGIRGASVALLLTGVVGGYHLGQDRDVEPQAVATEQVVRVDANELQLLKERHAQNAAARAPQRAAEADAAEQAAEAAKAAASKARKLQKAAIAKKAKEKAEAEEKAKAEPGADSGGSAPFTGPIPSSCNEYSGNRKIGCALTLQAGFGLSQFPCLNKLFNKESRWRTGARNPSSGAFGIPQALPGDKMASAGSDWRTNPATQIKWGLGYIKGRYGTPCNAWGHSQRVGWY